jgi:hypothetical protein
MLLERMVESDRIIIRVAWIDDKGQTQVTEDTVFK